MKIDNLIKNLQKNTTEQEQSIKEQAESVTQQHLENYKALLKASEEATASVIKENLRLIHQEQSEDQKRTTFEYIYRGSAGLDSIVSIPNSERHLVRGKA